MFQGLRQGSLLYILEKKDAPILKVGKVMTVCGPMPKYSTPQVGQMPIFEQVIDLTVETTEGRCEYKQVPALASVANFGAEGVILADSQQAMAIEVDAMRNASQNIVNSVDYHKKVVEACSSIMETLNPSVARERERDSELVSLRQQLEAQAGAISRIEQLITNGVLANTVSKREKKMAMVIEITDSDLEEMGQHVEKMLQHGGRLMSCIEKMKCDDMGYRNDRYKMGNRGGVSHRGGMGYRDDDDEDEYVNGMGMRRMRDSRGRYM